MGSVSMGEGEWLITYGRGRWGLRPDERLAISSQGKDSTLRIPLLAGDIMSSLSSATFYANT